MNFDKLQQQWQKEEVSTPEISLEHQHKINNPLQKIRKNMKMEIWLNIFSLILLIPLSKVFSENPFLRWTMMMVFFFIIFFFTFKFYLFYIKTKDYSIDTLNNLLEIKFELRTLKELYQAYYVSSIPFFMGMLFLFLGQHDFFKYEDLIMHYAPFIVFFSIVALVIGIGVWWFENYYGKYINQIENILNELK